MLPIACWRCSPGRRPPRCHRRTRQENKGALTYEIAAADAPAILVFVCPVVLFSRPELLEGSIRRVDYGQGAHGQDFKMVAGGKIGQLFELVLVVFHGDEAVVQYG